MKSFEFKGRLVTLLAVGIFAFYSCRPDEEGLIKNEPPVESPEDTTDAVLIGKVTEIGIAEGIEENLTIGASGGSLTTSDKRLKIEVPEGAFTSDQAVTVQPIANKNAPGIGFAYRLTPHDVTFSKPVKLTFTYTDQEVQSTTPEALAIAYQDKNKIWQAISGTQLDTINKTISVYTTHFSDWSLFMSLDLYPPTSVMNPGETIELEIIGYLSEDIFIPMTPGKEVPVVERRDLSQYVKEWKLAGAGVLKPNGPKATYTAPSITPAINPVAITLELDLKQKGRFFLVRNILIGEEGVYLKLDNGEYFHMISSVKYIPEAGISELTGGTTVEGENRGITIIWNGKIPIHTFIWNKELPLFNYNYDGRYMYLQTFQQQISPGRLEITGYGEVGGYVTGKFILEAAGLLDGQAPPGQEAWIKTALIEGYFRVKRI